MFRSMISVFTYLAELLSIMGSSSSREIVREEQARPPRHHFGQDVPVLRHYYHPVSVVLSLQRIRA